MKIPAWLAAVAASIQLLAGPPALEVLEFRGICDASAISLAGPDHFVVADDEDNVLRVYSLKDGGAPVRTADMSRFLSVDPKSPEADFEGAARIGDRVYWISSHGPNKRGKTRISRHQFFATSVTASNDVVRILPEGRPYSRLLQDLLGDARLHRFHLGAAASRPPKSRDGLSIEGLSATPEGTLLLGFRNPIPQGRALIVPLLNPDRVIGGEPARFGEAIQLDLGGLGIRSMNWMGNRYLIVAGPHDGGGESVLYEWNGGGETPRLRPDIAFAGLNPEALDGFEGPEGPMLLVVSDDGTFKIGGKDCKNLKDPNLKRFRALAIPY